MDTIYNLLKRAKELKEKSQVDSITPEEVGKLHEDTLAYIASLEQSADGLGIKKVYLSKSAMEADTDPVGTNGKALRYGQLVSIYDDAHADSSENGNIYAYQKPGWLLMGKVSGGTTLSITQELGDSVTKVMSQAAVTEALANVKAITDDGKNLQEVYSTLFLEKDAKATSYIDVMEAGYALFPDGRIAPRNAWRATRNFIELGETLRINVFFVGGDNNVNFVCFYDKNKEFLSGIPAGSQNYKADVSIPQGAKYVKFCTTIGSPAVAKVYRKKLHLSEMLFKPT